MMIDRKLPRHAGSVARVALVLALAVSLTAACGDTGQDPDEGQTAAAVSPRTRTDCDAVGEHLAALSQHQFRNLEGRKKKIMKTQLQLIREQFTSTCKNEQWTAAMRTCMTGAADLSAFNECGAPVPKGRGLPAPAVEQPEQRSNANQ